MRYKVESSHCYCHPETCSHWPWNVVDTKKNEIYLNVETEDKACKLAKALNKL